MTGIDQILDFSRVQGDKISLASIDANPYLEGDQSFTWTSGPSSEVGSAWIEQVSDGRAFLHLNVKGDATPEFTLEVLGTYGTLLPSDIIV